MGKGSALVKRTTVSGWMALSLTLVLLGATASSALAARTLNPGSVDFGNRQVGTSSPAQAHQLRVYCAGSEFICGLIFLLGASDKFTPVISLTGTNPSDFSQTNNCLGQLDGTTTTGQSCIINTTFTPTSPGPKTGTLSTGLGGPTATLTGTGVTTATPPTPPTPGGATQLSPPKLNLAAKKQELKKGKLTFFATTNVATTLAAGGSVKPTSKQLAGGVKTKVKAKVKSSVLRKLDQSGKAKAVVNVAATDQAGNTAIGKIKINLTD
jgi:hypothetical protein